MRKLALFATLAAVVLAHTGCTRWALRPMHAQRNNAAQPMPEKLGSLSSLMKSQATTAADEASQAQADTHAGLDNIPPELALARLNERQGDENKAHELYLAYIAKHPMNPIPYHRLGVMAARKSKLDEAERYMRKALEVAPPSVELLGDMGYLCYLQSRFDEAEHYLLLALEQAPDNASATNNLALVYGARGDFEKSLSYFRRVNDDAKSHANVAFAMTQHGNLEGARNEYLTALSIDKSLRTAANALVQIETKRKAAEAAAKRAGRQPMAPEASDRVIELSSARDGSAPTASRPAETPAYAPRFEPLVRTASTEQAAPPKQQQVPRPTAVEESSVAAMAQSQTASQQFAGDAADRLMPLPALPTVELAPPALSGESLASNEKIAPPLNFTANTASPPASSQFSRFSAAEPTSQTPLQANAQSSNSTDRAEEIFAQARQVSWQADEQLPSTSHSNFENIPIPTTAPLQTSDYAENETATADASKVRPAVHLGLSDLNEPVTEAAKAPVKTQFSDFGTAPARINVSSNTSSLGSHR